MTQERATSRNLFARSCLDARVSLSRHEPEYQEGGKKRNNMSAALLQLALLGLLKDNAQRMPR